MAKKFNLMDYMSKETETKEEETKALEEKIGNLTPDEKNFYSMDGIDELKQSIELVGLLQPLLVSEPNTEGKRTVIAGHRRLMALQQLVSEGKPQYEKVQVIERKRQDEIVDRLSLIMANRYRDKTEWEKMKETVETDRLLKELKKKVNLKGNLRELLAEIANTNTAKIGMYKLIAEKLIPELMEEFKENKIGVTVAYKATQLEKEQQEELWIILSETGTIGIQDVEKIKNKNTQTLEEKEPTEDNGDGYGENAEHYEKADVPEENRKKITDTESNPDKEESRQMEEDSETKSTEVEKYGANETENAAVEVQDEEAGGAAVEKTNEAEGEVPEELSDATVDGSQENALAEEEIMARLNMLKKVMKRYDMIFDLEFDRLETGVRSLNVIKKQDFLEENYEKAVKVSLQELNEGLL